MQSLFLKYRPQQFQDLVGQDAIISTLKNSIKNKKLVHAYLFCGSRGTGKTSTARIFAKGLNCKNVQNGEPCGECNFCVDTKNGTMVDVIEIDAASNRGIDEIRDLREKVLFSPNRAKRKIYIIDEVHMLTKEAFNALLKTLEEPPAHAFFILATTELHKIPETIKSRCQTFIFKKFNLAELVDRLAYIAEQEKISVQKESLDLIAKKAEGGMRDAISLLEQIASETENNITLEQVQNSLGISSQEILENFWDAISQKNAQAALDIIEKISINGVDFRMFGHDFLIFLRNKLYQNLENSAQIKIIINTVEQIEKAISRLKTSPIITLPFEIAVVNLTVDQNFSENTKQSANFTKPQPIIKNQDNQKKEDPILENKNNQVVNKEQKNTEIKNNINLENTKVSDFLEKNEKKTEPQKIEKISVENNLDISENKNSENNDKEISTSQNITDTKFANTEPQKPERLDGFVFDDAQKKSSQKIEIPSTKKQNYDISSQSIKQNQKIIAEKSGISASEKTSFLTAIPEVEAQKIIFYVNSMFHLEKLENPKIINLLQVAIKEIFGINYEIEFKIKKTEPTSTPQKKDTLKQATIDDFLDW